MAVGQQVLQGSALPADKRACCGRSDVRIAPRLHRLDYPRSSCPSAPRCTRVRVAAAAVEQQVSHAMLISVLARNQYRMLFKRQPPKCCMQPMSGTSAVLHRMLGYGAGDPRPRYGPSTRNPTMRTCSRGSGLRTSMGEASPSCTRMHQSIGISAVTYGWPFVYTRSNGVIDREELRALLESTDSGHQYSITVSAACPLRCSGP